ncbi:MAG: ABC transporter substrate-binding protein [Actinomycetota bacterium]
MRRVPVATALAIATLVGTSCTTTEVRTIRVPVEQSATASAAPEATASTNGRPGVGSTTVKTWDQDVPAGSLTASDVGVTATTIKIGHIGDFTGQARAFFGPQLDSLNAYIADLNAHGGIFGRRVQLVYYSGSYQSPDQVLAAARRLVEKDKVFAVVTQSGLDNANTSAMRYYNENGIPCIGCHAASQISEDLGASIFSNLVAPKIHGEILGAFLAKRLGKKQMALGFCPSSWSHQVKDSIKASFERYGGTVVDERDIGTCDQQTMEPTVTAWSSMVPRPDVVAVTDPIGMAEGAAAARRMGWSVQFTGPRGMAQLVLDIGGSQTEGLIGTTDGLAPPGTNTAELQRFRRVLKKYYPKRTEEQNTLRPWADMRMFEEAARRVGPNLTRAGLAKTLGELRGWSDGVGSPLSFAPKKHWGRSAIAFFRIHNQSFQRATEEDYFTINDF